MKRSVKLFLISLLLCIGCVPAGFLSAAGGNPSIEFTASTTSAAANGTKITFTVFTYRLGCPSGYVSGDYCQDGSPFSNVGEKDNELAILATGSGNTFGGTYTASNGATVVKTSTDGKATFTLASTVVESKKVQVYLNYPGYSASADDKNITVSFTTPPAPKTTPKTTTPAPEPVAPEAPKAATVEVDGQKATDEKIVVEETESLVLKGTTVPNGVVKLFIFSDPKEATVTADAQGNWSYTVEGLEPGDHHVEAQVTDPTTNKTSGRATLAAFTIKAKPVKAVAAAPAKGSQSLWLPYAAGAIVLLLGLGVGAWWWFRKHKNATTVAQDTPVATEATVAFSHSEHPNETDPK